MILSLHKSDNTCDAWYNPKKQPGILQYTKALKSGPERFGNSNSSQGPKSQQQLQSEDRFEISQQLRMTHR